MLSTPANFTVSPLFSTIFYVNIVAGGFSVMNKIRDLIYNVSDILVTLVIIIAALLLISWRVSAIMHYGTGDDSTASGTLITQDADTSDSETTENTDSDQTGNSTAAGDVSFTVSANQSAEAIGQALTTAGLVTDTQTFLNAVNSAGAATRLKVGTFTIPSGSTPEQIVAILTS